MKFNIIDKNIENKKRKNKQQTLMTYAFFFFIGLSILLMIIYFATRISNENKKTKANTQTNTQITPPKVIKGSETKDKEEKISYIDLSSTERPLAIVLDNENGNNIHAGLQDSYLNYELPLGNGKSRIIAIYKDKDINIVGPVESANHYFIDYAIESNAVLVSFGQSDKAKTDLSSGSINNINGREDTTSFAKDKNLEYPHNIFTSTIKLRNEFSTKNFSNTSNSWKIFNYSTDEVMVNSKEYAALGNKVNITYGTEHTVNYVYNSSNKYYTRNQNGKSHTDRKTKEQLHYKNIIIMRVNTNKDSNNYNIETTGIGEGFYITNGFSVPIKWEKESRSSKTIYKYSDGETIELNDGNTFIHVVPVESNIYIN